MLAFQPLRILLLEHVLLLLQKIGDVGNRGISGFPCLRGRCRVRQRMTIIAICVYGRVAEIVGSRASAIPTLAAASASMKYCVVLKFVHVCDMS